jgi:hypothetical protein
LEISQPLIRLVKRLDFGHVIGILSMPYVEVGH